MWSQLSLCLLVSLALASNQGWEDNTEYVYEVRGRSLSSLHEVSKDYSGIFIKAKLTIRPKSDGNLYAKIKDAQFAELNAPLNDWDTHVPDSQLKYEGLPVSDKPFKIITENGAIRDLTVSKDINNWEANFIKSIVSQYQLDLKGENAIASHINTLPQEGDNSAVYKTMEESVTGVTETLYEIHPLPEYSIQTKPWMVPKPEMKGENGDYIEVIKSKNFSNPRETPSYHYGFNEMNWVHPAGNKMGDFMSRTSVSRAVITGDLNSYVLQSSITVDQIFVAPTFNDKQRGSVNTMLNMTLVSVQANSGDNEEIPNEINLGTIVYRYDEPFSTSNQPRKGKTYEHDVPDASSESRSGKKEAVHDFLASRFRRNAPPNDVFYRMSFGSSDERDSSEESNQNWQQDKPELEKAPKSPLLPYTVGYNGQSFKKQQNVAQEAKKLTQRIAQEIQRPEKMQEKRTIAKFVTLSALLRIMDKSEMQQVAGQLYTEEQSGESAAAWKIYRDAVAEAGTGPSLLTIRDWIQSKKIQSQEDAQIIQALADSTRQPTEEYMRTFYQLIASPEVRYNPHLNATALLAFTKLAHETYIHVPISHSKFPENSFGRFWTKSGKKFVKNEVIPYLTEKLHFAVSEGDNQKIHVYIRALGNVGHRRILEAFEPYLEGQKQASQFQRVLMVVALDKLVYTYPNVARSVLTKIYQNPSEYDQVRVAAVYQLMRTNPSAPMLQRMASYTNADPSEYVNSAVKSSIQSAAKLEGSEEAELRQAAESAQHLLSQKEYGAQYSHNHLRSYVIDEMNLNYKQSCQTFGHEDHILPEGAHYNLRGRFGGLRQHIVDIQAFVSSVDDLVNVFEQQTEQYQKQKQRKDAENSEAQKWSSEYIAKILNMQFYHREQLEGNLYVNMGQMQRIISFDNKTIEMLPEVLQEFEEAMKSGKKFSLQKMVNDWDIAVAFPTAMGFPFTYTYDKPAFVSIEGKVRANAEPQISSENKLREPKRVKADFEIRVLVSGKAQSQLGFITPFNQKRHYAGYDKNFQVHVPVSGSVDIDVENLQAKVEIEGRTTQQQHTQLAHYSTLPYISQEKIYEIEPKHEKIICKQHPQRIVTVFGDKAIGVGMNLEITSDERIDMAWAYRKLQKHDSISALLSPLDENIQHMKIDLHVNLDQFTTQKAVFRFGAQHKYQSERTEENGSNSKPQISKFSEISEEPLKRQAEFAKGQGIKNADIRVYYASAEFQGEHKIQYTGVVAQSKSNVDSHGRVVAHFERKGGEYRPVYFALYAEGKIANTNGLNFKEAMQLDSTSTFEFEAAYGESYQKAMKINSRSKHSRSEERSRYLLQHPEVKECLRQMQNDGNNQLPVCAKATARANLLDKFEYKIDYQNLQPEVINATYKLYRALEHHVLYPNVDVNIAGAGNGQDAVEIQGQFSPDLKYLNASLVAKNIRGEVKNIPINEFTKHIMVPHPVFHVRSRLVGHAYNYPVYRPFCVVDKTAANTFDNKTYPLTLSNDWTVLLQYVPHRPSSKEKHPIHDAKQQLKRQIETYSVLARASQQEKEIKITLQTPYTGQKVFEINLKPSESQQYPKLFVNGEEIKYSTEQAADISEGYIQAYGLPKNEIKVEIRKAFYVIYDGQRAKVTIVDHKFRGAVQGLCGTFSGEPQTDFMNPQNCILRKPQEFVESYTVQEGGKQQQQQQQSEECYKKKVEYANVISSTDAGRTNNNAVSMNNGPRSCTKHQTQYVEEGGQVCFTVRPLPICKSDCRARATLNKQVLVHCVDKSNVSQLWVNEIKKGASPDFSLKAPTKAIKMDVPQGCSL